MHDFAQGLRELRAAAGSPPYRELARRARYSHSALSDAAAGHRLPTLEVTLALVAACGGDVDAWRARWTELDARLRSTHPELLAVQPDSGNDGVTADADAASGSVMRREDDKPFDPAGGSDRPQGPSPDTPPASDARPAPTPAATAPALPGAPAAAADPAPSATPHPPGPPATPASRTPTVVDSPAVKPLRKGDPARVGGFRLLGRLGSGAMGEVFLGQSAAGRPVALKVIRAEFAQDTVFRRRFAAEVATARRVQGPYTPAVVGADAEAERPWLATTYIAGPSLADVVRTAGPLPAPVVRALAAGISEALVAIHGADVLHRDLKPSNVLLDRDGPKVIDFGIARAADRTQLTDTGVAVGTVPYMSPEQAEGHPVGPPSDVFSLGALLTYAATGLTPFGEGSIGEVVYRITHDAPDPHALDVGEDKLRELITRCLEKDPERRPTPRQIIATCAHGPAHADWLPAAVAARIARREDDLADVLTRAARRHTATWLKVSALPLIVVLALAIVLAVTTRRNDPTLGTPAPGAGRGYQEVLHNQPVSLPDADHEIDLMTGHTVTGDRYWTLSTDSGGTSKGGFSLQDATDAYVAGSGRITPAQCAADVARDPVEDEVPWPQVPTGSWLCLRWRLTGDIAMLHISSLDTGSWGVDATLAYYRHIPSLSTPGLVPGSVGPGYRRLYAARPLTLPGADRPLDLARGRLTANGFWLLSTDADSKGDGKGAYELQDSSDAYIAGQSPVTPARCALGVAEHPVADKVRFPQVPAGTWFCVRDTITHDIAVIQVLDKDDGDWSTTIAVTAYRPIGAGGS
ncbi:protein kinase [Streptomyces sp. NPDC002766]|uniref:protein kinase domain-containing protein n=1 Tax=Streptomyces sp. NPDC002766 TaxID=3154429 RepID=UPI00332BB0BA